MVYLYDLIFVRKKYRNICMILPRGTPRRTQLSHRSWGFPMDGEICLYHSDTFQVQVTENPAQTGLNKNEICWLVTIKSRSMLASALIGSKDSDTVTGTQFLSPFLNSVPLGCSHVLVGLSCPSEEYQDFFPDSSNTSSRTESRH